MLYNVFSSGNIPGPISCRRVVVGHNEDEMRSGTDTQITASWKEKESDCGGGMRGVSEVRLI